MVAAENNISGCLTPFLWKINLAFAIGHAS